MSTSDLPGAGVSDAVTVAEALRVVLPGSRVLGGASGLARRVAWATSLRSRPPAFEPRGGGEFVLAPRGALESLHQADRSLSVARILEGLSQAGAAALASASPLPPDAAAIADALGLPLVTLPDGTALLEAERGIIGLVLGRHNELQARASQFYRQLAQLSVESQGLEAILQAAAGDTGLATAFEDAQFRLRAVAAPPGQPAPDTGDGQLSSVDERGRLNDAARSQPLSSTTPPAIALPAARLRLARVASPVVTRERLRGFVSLCGAPGSLTEFDQLAVSRLAAVCALELAKEDAVLAAEQRVQGDLVDELLRPYGDAEAVARHAAQAGLTRDAHFAVVVLEPASGAGPDVASRIADGASRLLRRRGQTALVRRDGVEVVVICQVPVGPHATPAAAAAPARPARPEPAGEAAGGPIDGPSDAARLDTEVRSLTRQIFEVALAEVGGGGVTAGASSPHVALSGIPAASREAREALRIGRRVYGTGRLVPYSDLGLYRVLHTLQGSPELTSFYEQTLGPLVDYDRRTGQNLVETLEAFFGCHGNLSQTAQRLQLHRNSLLYRIARIQEVGGVDLEDPETRLSLQVALKARRLLA